MNDLNDTMRFKAGFRGLFAPEFSGELFLVVGLQIHILIIERMKRKKALSEEAP